MGDPIMIGYNDGTISSLLLVLDMTMSVWYLGCRDGLHSREVLYWYWYRYSKVGSFLHSLMVDYDTLEVDSA